LLKIRLSRTGKTHQPSFRIIVQEKTMAVKGGNVVATLGHYKPATDPKELVIDLEAVKKWIANGAHPSDTAAVLFKKQGLEGMEKFIEPRNKKRKSKSEPTEAPVAPAAAPKVEEPKAA